MSQKKDFVAVMNDVPYPKKQILLEGTLNSIQRMGQRGQKIPRDTEEALKEYVFVELDNFVRDLSKAASYREKDEIFSCAGSVLGLIMQLWKKKEELSQEQLEKIWAFQDEMNKERYIEIALEKLFQQETITQEEISHVLTLVDQTPDEYQKSVLYTGLNYFKKQLSRLSDEAAQHITDFLTVEIKRYLASPALNGEQVRNLELIADICCVFADEEQMELLYEVAKLGHNNVNFYLTKTLLCRKAAVPGDIVAALARDMQYADLTYSLLKRYGKQALFPQACTAPEYLAKSHMIQWLMYPTELGKAPDDIEYVGKVSRLFKKEVYYIFKYRSDSENLDEASKNKWLLGWASEEGGTFSEFEEFARFEAPTLKATLKNIKKRVL